jgi:hypothetical protein
MWFPGKIPNLEQIYTTLWHCQYKYFNGTGKKHHFISEMSDIGKNRRAKENASSTKLLEASLH